MLYTVMVVKGVPGLSVTHTPNLVLNTRQICVYIIPYPPLWLWWGTKHSKPNWRNILLPWASYQIRKIASHACAWDAGNVFPATDFKRNYQLTIRHAPRHVIQARAVIRVGIANPRWRGKYSRHSRRMRNPQFYATSKRPIGREGEGLRLIGS